MNLFGSNVTPDPNIKPIPLWLRVPFWAAGGGIILLWFARIEGSIVEFNIFLAMFGVVFVGILIAMPALLISLGGSLLLLFRKHNTALRAFNLALRWNPGEANYYLSRGYALFQLGKYPDCIADMTRALEAKPRHFQALFHRGTSLYMQENHEQALLDLSEAAQVKPQNTVVQVNLANTYLDAERYEEARRHYEAVLEHQPNHFVALTNIGSSYADEGDHERAVEYYDRALAAYPQPFTYCNRGLSHFMLGDEAQAEADFARGFEAAPNQNVLGEDELRFMVRGQYHLMRGDYDGALADLQYANEQHPSRKDTLAGLAATHLMMGHTDAARNVWNLLLERDSRFGDIAFVQRRTQWPPTIMDQVKVLLV